MKNIEVEIRSFLSDEKYQELLEYFREHAKLVKEDYQETFYFDCEEDLRIQKNDFGSKIWMKKGRLHDDHREEIEIKFGKDQFGDLEHLFISLGYGVDIKWFRKRFMFDWDGIIVCLDDTKGYGKIIELEQMATDDEKESIYEELKKKLNGLGIEISAKEEFDEKYQNYKDNWQELVKE